MSQLGAGFWNPKLNRFQRSQVGSSSTQEGNSMEAIGLLVTLEALPGKEPDAEAFLKSAQPLALDEKGTLKWHAIKLGAGEVRHLRYLCK